MIFSASARRDDALPGQHGGMGLGARDILARQTRSKPIETLMRSMIEDGPLAKRPPQSWLAAPRLESALVDLGVSFAVMGCSLLEAKGKCGTGYEKGGQYA